MKQKLPILVSFIAAYVIGDNHPAYAQSVDYGSMQNLFGEPITTNVTGTPLRASDVPANMTIVTADQIRQSGSRNIPEILGMYVPGINVLQEGIDAYDVGIRGYEQPYQSHLLVLIDGRQVFNDDYSRTDWANLPVNVDDIRQIEVVSGASSALFGSNATGGVINIITYSPVYDSSNVATIGVGTQDTIFGDATSTLHFGEGSGIKVSAGGLDQHEFNTARTPEDSTAGTVPPYHRYVSQNSEYKMSESVTFMTEATYSQKKDQEAVFIDAIDPVDSTSYSARGSVAWKSPFGVIKDNTYINRTDTTLNAGTRGTIKLADQLVVSQIEDQFKFGDDHTFRTFLEFRNKQQSSDGYPVLVYEHPDFKSDTYAAGGTWLWQIDDQWSLTNALRIDDVSQGMGGTLGPAPLYPIKDYSRSYDTVSANSGLVYKMTNDDTLRITYAHGVSDPSLVQNGFNHAIVTGLTSVINFEGNPFLKPTLVDNYGFSYEHGLSDIYSNLKLATYYEINKDLIAFQAAAPRTIGGITYTYNSANNVGDSRGVGGEIDLNGKYSGFRWDGSYSYQTARDATMVAETLDYSKSAPENQLRLNLGYSFNKWEADLHGQIATSTDMLRFVTVLQQVNTSSYYTLGARLGYNLTDNATVALSGSSLTRAYTEESPYPTIERTILVSLTDKF